MQIFIKNLSGKAMTYVVEPTDTILSLKRQVREKEEMPLCYIRLIFSGRSLQNDTTLLNCQVYECATIQLLCSSARVYCEGCAIPALIYLSANVSLQCGEKLTFDDEQLLHSIKTKLINLNDDTSKAIISCIASCGYEWGTVENDDADYFQNYAQQRQSQAIATFIGTICKMINPYLEKYRSAKMIDSTKSPDHYMNAIRSTENKSINVDWLTFLHQTRCPICFCRFSNVQPTANIPNRMPMVLCSVSNKHIICQDCCQNIHLCPLCNGTLATNIFPAQSMIDRIEKARTKLENYCFPSYLTKEITIKSNQQPIAHGAMGQLFRINDKYAVKCALIANTVDTEGALIHEIALSRPLAHISHLVAVYGGVRLPQHGIGIVMEYINGPSLAAALAVNSTIIRNLTTRERLRIALGIAQGLGELHLAKLVHRDFKPENVLLSQSADGTYLPKIADFGVSFQLTIASATAVKESCGTTGYDAPEVAINNQTPSAASDIYALAFVLYELLTAKRVFAGLKPTQILANCTMRGERPRDWPNDIPDLLKLVIEKAWSVEPNQRAKIGNIIHAIRKSLDPNQLSCIEMLQESNRLRKQVASIQLEDLKSFQLFALNEFIKRMTIDDCEAMQMFIDKLPPSL